MVFPGKVCVAAGVATSAARQPSVAIARARMIISPLAIVYRVAGDHSDFRPREAGLGKRFWCLTASRYWLSRIPALARMSWLWRNASTMEADALNHMRRKASEADTQSMIPKSGNRFSEKDHAQPRS